MAVNALDMEESFSVGQGVTVILRLARWLASRRFDVIHSFLPRANVVSRVANRLSRRSAVHFSSEHSTDYRRSRVVSIGNRLTAPWTDLVLAVSPRVRGVLTSRDRLPPEKIRVLANPVDLRAIDAAAAAALHQELGLDDRSLLACSVGRLVRDKGHVYLVQALAELAPRWPQLHLTLVGDGPEEETIRRQVAACGLEHRVHLLGFRTDVVGILKACDLFVLPSLEEGLPVTLLEAMACGCPVIATDVGDVSTLVEDGETGLLVPPAESWQATAEQAPSPQDQLNAEQAVSCLGAALDRLARAPEARHRLSRGARRRVEQRYALDAIVTALEELYREHTPRSA